MTLPDGSCKGLKEASAETMAAYHKQPKVAASGHEIAKAVELLVAKPRKAQEDSIPQKVAGQASWQPKLYTDRFTGDVYKHLLLHAGGIIVSIPAKLLAVGLHFHHTPYS